LNTEANKIKHAVASKHHPFLFNTCGIDLFNRKEQ